MLGLELCAQDMVDTQLAGHWLHLHPCRRCRDDNGVALVLVGAHQPPCPMEERTGDLLGEQLFPELHQLVVGSSHPAPDPLQHQVFERGFVERAAECSEHRADELVGSQFKVARAVRDQGVGRVSLDQGSVEIEERRDLGAAGSCLDVGDDVFDRDHLRCGTGHFPSCLRRAVADHLPGPDAARRSPVLGQGVVPRRRGGCLVEVALAPAISL